MKQVLRVFISIGISLTILALLLRLLSSDLDQQHRPSVLSVLQLSSHHWLFAGLAIYLLTLFIRAVRYRLLLTVSGEVNVPSLLQMAQVTGIRNMIVDMLPARLGELGYIGILNRGYNVALVHCVSSLTIAIAFDFLALVFIVLLVVLKQIFAAGIQGWALGALLGAIVISSIAFVALFLVVPKIVIWFNGVNDRNAQVRDESLNPRWRYRASQLLNDFNSSLESVRKSGRSGTVLNLSLMIRALKYLGLYCLFLAVTTISYADLAALPIETVISALIGGEVAASLPLPSFMGFGVYEAGATLVFHLIGAVDQIAVVVSMLCTHIWSQFMEYVIGGVLLVFLFIKRPILSSATLRDNSPNVHPNRSHTLSIKAWATIVFSALLLIASLVFFLWEVRAVKKSGATSAPPSGAAVVPVLSPDSGDNTQKLPKGFIVFSSNRDGNHDIFKMSLPDRRLSKLTDHLNTETYPRISADGLKLVFARSQQPWVSQRNLVAWDIYVLDLESGQEKKMGSNGTSPHWLDDDHIIFLQGGDKVVRVNISSGQEQIVYQTGVNNPMPSGAKLSNPMLNPVSGQLVFTARQRDIGMYSGHWGTAIHSEGDHRGVLNGCELSWSHNGSQLFQVATGANAVDHKIVLIDPSSLAVSDLINLDGEFSNEYWPKDSNDGQYLVFGSSRGGGEHEHDTADYEIFLWKFGSDSSNAIRLTFHTGNDNWPDVHIF